MDRRFKVLEISNVRSLPQEAQGEARHRVGEWEKVMSMRIGTVLRRYRRVEDMDLRTMAKQLGISAATLMRVEIGHDPEGQTLAKLLRWMLEPVAIGPSYLTGRKKPTPEAKR